MSRFAEIGKKVSGESPVTHGREKLSTDDILSIYGGEVTLTAFDLFTGDSGEPYAVFAIGEADDKFFAGGKLLTEFALDMVKACDGSLTDANEELAGEPVKIRIAKTKTKKGKDCVVFTVIDD